MPGKKRNDGGRMTVTVNMDPKCWHRLERLVAVTHTSRADVIRNAVRHCPENLLVPAGLAEAADTDR